MCSHWIIYSLWWSLILRKLPQRYAIYSEWRDQRRCIYPLETCRNIFLMSDSSTNLFIQGLEPLFTFRIYLTTMFSLKSPSIVTYQINRKNNYSKKSAKNLGESACSEPVKIIVDWSWLRNEGKSIHHICRLKGLINFTRTCGESKSIEVGLLWLIIEAFYDYAGILDHTFDEIEIDLIVQT